MDWQRVRVNIDPAVPLEVLVERAGGSFTTELHLTEERDLSCRCPPWTAGVPAGPGHHAGLAILVAVRRASQPSALLGALLLASIATVSLVLPMRMAVFWQSLPSPIGMLLWLPSVERRSGAAAARLLRDLSAAHLVSPPPGLVLIPSVIVVSWSVYANYIDHPRSRSRNRTAGLDRVGVCRQCRVCDRRHRDVAGT